MSAILRKLSRDVPAMLGLGIVVIVLLLAIFGPLLAPYPGDASASHLLRRLKPPSLDYPFGTDNLGRDMFSRVILGTRGALEVALAVVTIAAAIGVPLGLIAGYMTGWLSEAGAELITGVAELLGFEMGNGGSTRPKAVRYTS